MPTNSKEYMREYYHKNREKFLCKYSGTYYCAACDTTVARSYLKRHNRTEKHQMNILMCKSATPKLNPVENYEKIKTLRDEIKVKLTQVHRLEKEFHDNAGSETSNLIAS